jgi:hypothetical protein
MVAGVPTQDTEFSSVVGVTVNGTERTKLFRLSNCVEMLEVVPVDVPPITVTPGGKLPMVHAHVVIAGAIGFM